MTWRFNPEIFPAYSCCEQTNTYHGSYKDRNSFGFQKKHSLDFDYKEFSIS